MKAAIDCQTIVTLIFTYAMKIFLFPLFFEVINISINKFSNYRKQIRDKRAIFIIKQFCETWESFSFSLARRLIWSRESIDLKLVDGISKASSSVLRLRKQHLCDTLHACWQIINTSCIICFLKRQGKRCRNRKMFSLQNALEIFGFKSPP